MLFKQSQEPANFKMDDIFKNPIISKGLIKIEKPAVLNMKPAELYARIKDIAQKRYGLTLPENQTELRCLQSATTKLSLLRDICIKVGIKVLSHSSKDYILDNSIETLETKLAQQ